MAVTLPIPEGQFNPAKRSHLILLAELISGNVRNLYAAMVTAWGSSLTLTPVSPSSPMALVDSTWANLQVLATETLAQTGTRPEILNTPSHRGSLRIAEINQAFRAIEALM